MFAVALSNGFHFGSNLFDVIALDHISDLNVIVVLDSDAALISGLDFLDVILEALGQFTKLADRHFAPMRSNHHRQLLLFAAGAVFAVAFSPDGSTLAGMASCVSAELSGDETAGEVVTAAHIGGAGSSQAWQIRRQMVNEL